MVRAILAGTKSQTRRIVKPQLTGEPRPLSEWSSSLAAACHDASPDPAKLRAHSDRLRGRIFPFADGRGSLYSPSCPYGRPGELLWVRETFQTVFERRDGQRFTEARVGVQYPKRWIEYAATSSEPPPKWRPSIFMPRKYSRIILRITAVRVERLLEIDNEDAASEGWPGPDEANTIRSAYPIAWYSHLWESINGKGSWEANPWVWVVTFERVKANG